MLSLSQEYRNKFASNTDIIEIIPGISIETEDVGLTPDSYDKPKNNTFLIIDEDNTDNNVDIEFAGTVEVDPGIKNHGRIKCRHIVFLGDNICNIALLDTAFIEIIGDVEVIFSFNTSVLSYIGKDDDSDLLDYFPNLIISTCKNFSSGLLYIDVQQENLLTLMSLNKDHEYFPVISNSSLYKKYFDNENNTFLIRGNDNYLSADKEPIIFSIIKSVKKHSGPLIKNAYK